MTTSIDPSVDELLLLQENQYHMPNFVFANIKPIGAERKIGLPTNASTKIKPSLLSSQRLVYPMNTDFVSNDIQENNYYLNSFEIPSSIKSSTLSIYDHFQFSPIDESLIPQTHNEIEPLTYHSFHNYSSSSASSTSGSSTTHSPRSPSHLFDNYTYQRQLSSSSSSSLAQQKINQSISTRIQTAKTIPSFCPTQTYSTNRFSSQHYSRNPFLNICQQTRTTQPVFTAPFQCTRERFQVNSIGRPILRANNYNHLSQVHHFKVRR